MLLIETIPRQIIAYFAITFSAFKWKRVDKVQKLNSKQPRNQQNVNHFDARGEFSPKKSEKSGPPES